MEKNRKSSLLQSDFVCCMEKKIGKVPCCSLISYVVWKKNRKSSLLQSDFVGCMEKNRKNSLLQSDFLCCMEKNRKSSLLQSDFVGCMEIIVKVPCCILIPYVVWKKNREKFPAAVSKYSHFKSFRSVNVIIGFLLCIYSHFIFWFPKS